MKEQLLYGLHAVRAVIGTRAVDVRELILAKGTGSQIDSLAGEAQSVGIPVQYRDRKSLDEMASGAVHQGAVARLHGPLELDQDKLDLLLDQAGNEPLLLILDGVQDPHNLGACLRTAEAAGVAAVIAPRDRACPLNATAVKVASGAAGLVPFASVTNLARAIDGIKQRGIWVVGTADDGDTSLHDTRLEGALAIVMGGEGKGMRRLTRESCDHVVRIPMRGTVASLNVSVATGIALFEALRQRMRTDPH